MHELKKKLREGVINTGHYIRDVCDSYKTNSIKRVNYKSFKASYLVWLGSLTPMRVEEITRGLGEVQE